MADESTTATFLLASVLQDASPRFPYGHGPSAATFVMCNHRGACACGRGLDSGFVSAIKFYRARMGLSVRSDVAGGIFSF